MATRIPDAAQNAAVDAVVDRADVGAGAATLKIYTGSQPADADTDPAGTLLVTVTLNDPAFGAAASGSAALDVSPVPSGVGVAAGTAGCFAIEDSTGVNVVQGNVTGTGGGGDIELDNTSIAVDQTVNITGLTVSIPASE
jgi:hypothetical protein